MISGFIAYNILLMVVLFFGFTYNKSKNYVSAQLSFFFILSAIVLFCGVRFNVGTDYSSYVDIFKHGGRDTKYTEIGWVLINKLFSFSKFGFVGVFIVSALITYYFWIKIFKEHEIVFYGLFFLITYSYVIYANNAVRQAIAIPITFYALRYINEQKFWKYFLALFLTGILIHKSAFFFIPVYFLIKMPSTKKFWFSIILVALVFSNASISVFIRDNLINFLADLAPNYKWYLMKNIINHEGASIYTILPIFLRVAIVIFILFTTDFIYHDFKGLLLRIAIIGFLFGFLSFEVKIFTRIYQYFDFINILLFAIYFKSLKPSLNSQIIKVIMILLFFCLYQLKFIVNSNNCVPYQTIFGNL